MQRKITASFLTELRDPPSGTIGVVEHVDDIGTIHVKWETGSTLGVVWGEDKIMLVDKVVTICNGERKVWEHREDAVKFYAQALANGEGAMLRKYLNVLCSLFLDLVICTD